MNKDIFESNWKQIRSHISPSWSLMADFDLLKVDKAEVKFDKLVNMLQVKYGYTREQARKEIGIRVAVYEAQHKSMAAPEPKKAGKPKRRAAAPAAK